MVPKWEASVHGSSKLALKHVWCMYWRIMREMLLGAWTPRPWKQWLLPLCFVGLPCVVTPLRYPRVFSKTLLNTIANLSLVLGDYGRVSVLTWEYLILRVLGWPEEAGYSKQLPPEKIRVGIQIQTWQVAANTTPGMQIYPSLRHRKNIKGEKPV